MEANNNTAAMREALEDSNGLLEELAKTGEWGDAANCQIADNKAALAAPPRNCDKYNDHKTAVYAYLADCNKRGIAPHWAEAIRWLLSPATEQKGGSK